MSRGLPTHHTLSTQHSHTATTGNPLPSRKRTADKPPPAPRAQRASEASAQSITAEGGYPINPPGGAGGGINKGPQTPMNHQYRVRR